ncbi:MULTISPECIES: hypothetical protein [unclassified Pseudonocardia]|uniref:hypothetical protein n=1 Tax=unclassified Pseudonocardia TaxID=2619320 RepID=UPI0011AE5FBD|nr:MULTISPECIES: hypothetical protein [unclassified Pseudonocardia]
MSELSERLTAMFVYDRTEAAKAHRLTLAMCLALLAVGTVRPVTVRALVVRDLAVWDLFGGWALTEKGRKVGRWLEAEASIEKHTDALLTHG